MLLAVVIRQGDEVHPSGPVIPLLTEFVACAHHERAEILVSAYTHVVTSFCELLPERHERLDVAARPRRQ